MAEPTIAANNILDTKNMADMLVPQTPTTFIAQDIKDKATQPAMTQNPFVQSKSLFATPFQPEKRALGGYANESFEQAYAPLSDGSYISRYKDFLPGTNNENRLAKDQSVGEQWAHGFEKLGLKTLTAVAGGTIGVVDSVVEGIAKGSLSEAYNTRFNNWLDDLNTEMDYKLPNYYTDQEKNASLFGQATTANFWADKVLGGVSFTLGAIISEGIWAAATGGTSLLAEGALGGLSRWTARGLGGEANLLKSLNTAKIWAKGSSRAALEAGADAAAGIGDDLLKTISAADKNAAIQGYNFSKTANIALTGLRSAGFESGMEARQYMKETEHNWLENYKKENGHDPTSEDYVAFKNGLENTGNLVFLANMAIVGTSNLVQFHNGIMGKTVSNSVENGWAGRTFFGIGFDRVADETGKTTLKALEATTAQKIASKTWGVAKNIFAEGQEEMSQSVASNTAKNYMLAAYSGDKTKATYGVAEAFYDAAAKAYGTKEGLTEGFVGGIVGLLGAAASTRGKFDEVSQQRAGVQEMVDYSNKFTTDMHINNIIAHNKIQAAQEQKTNAQAKNDLVGELISDTSSAIAHIERNFAIGSVQEGVKDFTLQMKAISNTELAEQLGFSPDVEGEEMAKKFKEQKIAEYADLAKNHTRNLQYAEALLGESEIAGLDNFSKREVERAIAYNITMGQKATEINQSLVNQAKSLLAGNLSSGTDALSVQQVLDLAPKEKQAQLVKLSLQEQRLQQNYNALLKRQFDAQKLKDTPENKLRTNTLIDIDRDMQETNSQIQKTREERQIALDALGVENYTTDAITLDMLDSQKQNLDKLRQTIDGIKHSDPQKYATVKKILEEQGKAVQHIKEYDTTSRTIADPKTRIKLLNGWMTSLLNRNTKLSEGTEAYFTGVVESWRAGTAETFQDTTERDQRKNFRQGKEVDPEYVKTLQVQKDRGDSLNDTDSQILAKYAPETESGITIPDPNVVVDVQIGEVEERRRKELKENENKILSGRNTYEFQMDDHAADQKFVAVTVTFRDGGKKTKVTTTDGSTIYEESWNKQQVEAFTEEEYLNKHFPITKISKTHAESTEEAEKRSFLLKKINDKYDNEIKKLRSETSRQVSDPIKNLREKVREIISGENYLMQYFGQDVQELAKRHPSKEDVERYQQLLAKINIGAEPRISNILKRPADFYSKRKIDIGLSSEEVQEFQALNQIQNDWKTLSGAFAGDNSVASLLEMIEKLQKEEVRNQTKTEQNDSDYKAAMDATAVMSRESETTTRGLQTPTIALVTPIGENYVFSHIGIDTLQSFFPQSTVSMDKQDTALSSEQFKRLSKTEGTEFTLHVGPETLSIRVNRHAGLEVNRAKFEAMQDLSNILVKNFGGKNPAMQIHQKVGDTDVYAQVQSDFDYRSRNSQESWTINEGAVNEAKPGDVLDLLVNLNDAYNDALLANTEDLTKEEKQEKIAQIHIYAVKNGTQELMGSIPAGQAKQKDSEIGQELQRLREAAYKAAIKAKKDGTQKLIKLVRQAEVQITFIGVPNVLVEQDSDGNAKTKNIAFTKEALQQVEGTGYIQDGEITANHAVDVKQFVERVSKLNPGEKVPFVVFNYNGKSVAFAVDLVKTTIDQSIGVSEILNGDLPSNDKANALIDTLLENGIAAKNYNIDFTDEDWIHSPETARALDDLSKVEIFADAEQFASKNYNKEALVTDAKIAIDIANKPFASSKLMIAPSNEVSTSTPLAQQREYSEEERVELVQDLSEEGIKLYNEFVTNPAFSNVTDTQFSNTFDESPIEATDNYLEQVKNINILKEAFAKPVLGTVRNVFGEERIRKIKNMIDQFDSTIEKEAKIKVAIKSDKVAPQSPAVKTGGEVYPSATNFELVETIPYTEPEINKYKPSQQLKFNQGYNYEPVRLVGEDDLIELITIGSRISKGNPIGTENRQVLEEKFGITATEAYNRAKDIARKGRSATVENILLIGRPQSGLGAEVDEILRPC